MNSIVVEVNNNKYLVRYKVLKSVVTRKHTEYKWVEDTTPNPYGHEIYKEVKVAVVSNRLELHPTSVVVYLYQVNYNCHKDDYLGVSKLKIKNEVKDTYLTYLGRGLSKCSDKDKFDKNKGVRTAIANMNNIPNRLAIIWMIAKSKL